MTSDQQQLKMTLADLHQQLSDARTLDPALQQQLSLVLADIQAALARSTDHAAPLEAEQAAEDYSLAGRLNEAARHFEETHPTLAGNINSIVDTLARMGI